MADQVSAETAAELLTTLFADEGGDALLVDPPATLLAALGGVETDALPETLSVLAREEPLKTARDDFLLASNLADHVEADRVGVRVLAGSGETPLFATADSVYAVVDTEGLRSIAFATDDDGVIDDVYEAYQERFDDAEAFDLRTPGRTRAMKQLATDVGAGVQEDFHAVLASLGEVTEETVDEVTLALLIAARNEAQLYDISKWGEDTGVASKATFSRTKGELEENGFIETEKVPIDVGRPRLRLLLADDELASADLDEFADVAQQKL